MKLKSILLLFFVSLTFVNCKNDGKQSETDNQTQEVETNKNVFKVAINVLVKKNDNFCLLYTEDGTINFKEGVWQEVKGSDNEQIVEFSLPDDVFPSQLRLDLGQNLDQEDIVIKTVTFSYLDNSRVLEGPQIGVFFRPDDSKCTFDYSTGLVKALIVQGVKQAPSLYPHETVQSVELPKLYQ
ncbi:MAG: hypothetical protein ACOVQR_13325 [Flavobacterium sp.]|jgi:hypothetical protein|uniref:hypothetical protein n=1 Tax=Flavobacterium sp. TaxID=239 RepID=UPI003BA57BEC